MAGHLVFLKLPRQCWHAKDFRNCCNRGWLLYVRICRKQPACKGGWYHVWHKSSQRESPTFLLHYAAFLLHLPIGSGHSFPRKRWAYLFREGFQMVSREWQTSVWVCTPKYGFHRALAFFLNELPAVCVCVLEVTCSPLSLEINSAWLQPHKLLATFGNPEPCPISLWVLMAPWLSGLDPWDCLISHNSCCI